MTTIHQGSADAHLDPVDSSVIDFAVLEEIASSQGVTKTAIDQVDTLKPSTPLVDASIYTAPAQTPQLAPNVPDTAPPDAIAAAQIPAAAMAKNTYTVAKELIETATQWANSMPDSEDKVVLIDFLAKIAKVLMVYAQFLQTGSASADAEQSADWAQAMKEGSDSRLAEQQKAQKEIQHKMHKAHKKAKEMGTISKVMTALMVVAMVMAMGPAAPLLASLGPVAATFMMTMMTAVLVDSVMRLAGDKEGIFMRTADALGEGISALARKAGAGPEVADQISIAVEFAAVLALCVAIIAVAPSMATGVGTLMIQQILMSSGVLSDLVKTAGGTAQDAMIVQIVVSSVLILASLGMAYKSASQIESQAALGSGKIAEFIKQAPPLVQTLFRAMIPAQDGVDIVTKLTGTSMVVLQGAESGVGYANSQIQADTTMIKATLEKDMELKDTLVKMIKKLREALTEAMDGDLKGAMQVVRQVSTMYKDASRTLTDLHSRG